MIANLKLGGHEVEIETSQDVFAPTSTTRKLAQHVRIPKDGTVLDLGCGSGPLTVMAALEGASRVVAVDVMPEACELTLRNAARAGVADRVEARCGSLFEPVQDMKFDVIVDDEPGRAVAGNVGESPADPDHVFARRILHPELHVRNALIHGGLHAGVVAGDRPGEYEVEPEPVRHGAWPESTPRKARSKSFQTGSSPRQHSARTTSEG